MRRLIPLLGAVLALALAGTANADTFRVVHSHAPASGAGTVAFASDSVMVPFTSTQTGPMSFGALRGIWQAAGSTYGVPWEVLAAINKVETDFGRNLGPSSAGAIGWMQFMPSTWARWGVDANGDGIADPDNPTDAIFSAARYLAACGGQFDIARAVYCYNHANWYVSEVLGLAAQYGRGGGDQSTGLFAVDHLQTQLASARQQVTASNARLVAVRAHARKLASAQRRFLRVATTAPLLSDQLAARKQAVLLGIRRDAAVARAARLRKQLDSARTMLGSLKNQASAPSTLLSMPAFADGALNGPDSNVVPIALQYLGVRYVWAGATPQGFDCSGLVQYAFRQLGVSLPHNTVAQWNDPQAVSVPRNALEPGDLVFFDKLDHVGIYIGDGYFVDAPHTGTTVRIDSLSDGWYAAKYDGAKRIVSGGLGGSADAFGAMTFTTGGGSSFASNVVYFTH